MDKNKANVPKIRFPGFTDPWEQRKFCDEVKTRRGLTYKPSDIQEKGIRVLRSSNIDGDQFVLKEDDIFVSLKAINIDYIKENDILITSANGSSKLVGKHALVSKIGKKSAVHGGFMLLGTANEPFFVNASMSSEWYKRFIDLYVSGGNGAIGNLSKSDLDKQEVMFPSRAEQAQIGVFFKNIDKLITLHQRKLKHLQDKKKSLLQKMFPKNGENFPELRFPGFTDPWEQRKLGDAVERITRKNSELESTLPLTISAQYGFVDQFTFFNKRIASRDIRGYYLLRKGEFAYNKSYSEGYPWGVVKRLERYEKGVVSTLYICFKLTNVNSNFLVSYYDTNNWYNEVAQRAAEGARNHGLLNISADDFFDTKLVIPKSKEEQATIGYFFQELNNLIALHQRKLKHLQEQKKALLQQMFV